MLDLRLMVGVKIYEMFRKLFVAKSVVCLALICFAYHPLENFLNAKEWCVLFLRCVIIFSHCHVKTYLLYVYHFCSLSNNIFNPWNILCIHFLTRKVDYVIQLIWVHKWIATIMIYLISIHAIIFAIYFN